MRDYQSAVIPQHHSYLSHLLFVLLLLHPFWTILKGYIDHVFSSGLLLVSIRYPVSSRLSEFSRVGSLVVLLLYIIAFCLKVLILYRIAFCLP